ncbi:NIPSNAP family protein [Minwuia sp.]|uniref:NIPSNAP family protein n=1 Tax=Minwuia sp. TaxID=2493630 RepID=UPI003A94ADBE
MPIYELRTYTLHTGKLGEAVELYKTIGWPALQKHPEKLVGYFTGDVGAMNKIIHIWKFDDDADRRAFWAGVFSDDEFMKFAGKFRPLVLTQENQLMLNAPWGPTP